MNIDVNNENVWTLITTINHDPLYVSLGWICRCSLTHLLPHRSSYVYNHRFINETIHNIDSSHRLEPENDSRRMKRAYRRQWRRWHAKVSFTIELWGVLPKLSSVELMYPRWFDRGMSFCSVGSTPILKVVRPRTLLSPGKTQWQQYISKLTTDRTRFFTFATPAHIRVTSSFLSNANKLEWKCRRHSASPVWYSGCPYNIL